MDRWCPSGTSPISPINYSAGVSENFSLFHFVYGQKKILHTKWSSMQIIVTQHKNLILIKIEILMKTHVVFPKKQQQETQTQMIIKINSNK